MTVFTYPVGPLLTNCYIVTSPSSENEALLIDPAFGEHKLLGFLKEKGLHPSAVVLTHCHFDHMWAVDELCKKGIPFYCPYGDLSALTDPLHNASLYFGKELLVKTSPSRLLKEGDILSLGEELLTVLETPGHTEGSICLVGEGLIFSGDTLFHHGYGRTDLPGGNEEQLFLSLRRLLSLDDRTVYPGHGKQTTISKEKAFFGF